MAACQEYGIVRPDQTRPLPKLSGPTPPQPLYFEAIPCGTPAPIACSLLYFQPAACLYFNKTVFLAAAC